MALHKHPCIVLRVEHEGDYIVEEEVVPQTEEPPVENNLYFDICGEETALLATQGKPRCIYPFSCVLKSFSHLI
jgi:hypothetical protein